MSILDQLFQQLYPSKPKQGKPQDNTNYSLSVGSVESLGYAIAGTLNAGASAYVDEVAKRVDKAADSIAITVSAGGDPHAPFEFKIGPSTAVGLLMNPEATLESLVEGAKAGYNARYGWPGTIVSRGSEDLAKAIFYSRIRKLVDKYVEASGAESEKAKRLRALVDYTLKIDDSMYTFKGDIPGIDLVYKGRKLDSTYLIWKLIPYGFLYSNEWGDSAGIEGEDYSSYLDNQLFGTPLPTPDPNNQASVNMRRYRVPSKGVAEKFYSSLKGFRLNEGYTEDDSKLWAAEILDRVQRAIVDLPSEYVKDEESLKQLAYRLYGIDGKNISGREKKKVDDFVKKMKISNNGIDQLRLVIGSARGGKAAESDRRTLEFFEIYLSHYLGSRATTIGGSINKTELDKIMAVLHNQPEGEASVASFLSKNLGYVFTGATAGTKDVLRTSVLRGIVGLMLEEFPDSELSGIFAMKSDARQILEAELAKKMNNELEMIDRIIGQRDIYLGALGSIGIDPLAGKIDAGVFIKNYILTANGWGMLAYDKFASVPAIGRIIASEVIEAQLPAMIYLFHPDTIIRSIWDGDFWKYAFAFGNKWGNRDNLERQLEEWKKIIIEGQKLSSRGNRIKLYTEKLLKSTHLGFWEIVFKFKEYIGGEKFFFNQKMAFDLGRLIYGVVGKPYKFDEVLRKGLKGMLKDFIANRYGTVGLRYLLMLLRINASNMSQVDMANLALQIFNVGPGRFLGDLAKRKFMESISKEAIKDFLQKSIAKIIGEGAVRKLLDSIFVWLANLVGGTIAPIIGNIIAFVVSGVVTKVFWATLKTLVKILALIVIVLVIFFTDIFGMLGSVISNPVIPGPVPIPNTSGSAVLATKLDLSGWTYGKGVMDHYSIANNHGAIWYNHMVNTEGIRPEYVRSDTPVIEWAVLHWTAGSGSYSSVMGVVRSFTSSEETNYCIVTLPILGCVKWVASAHHCSNYLTESDGTIHVLFNPGEACIQATDKRLNSNKAISFENGGTVWSGMTDSLGSYTDTMTDLQAEADAYVIATCIDAGYCTSDISLIGHYEVPRAKRTGKIDPGPYFIAQVCNYLISWGYNQVRCNHVTDYYPGVIPGGDVDLNRDFNW